MGNTALAEYLRIILRLMADVKSAGAGMEKELRCRIDSILKLFFLFSENFENAESMASYHDFRYFFSNGARNL